MYQHITVVDKYDPISGLYYKSISNEEKKAMFSKVSGSNHTSNVAIFNPQDETFTMLFGEKKDIQINLFLFETGYDEKYMQIEFQDANSYIVRNNEKIEKRAMKNKLLIGLVKEENMELWTANRQGEELNLLTVVPKASSWHIDVKNSKIRVIDVSDHRFKIENFDW
ncbi:MAG: hypothetical protein KAG56_10455 [Sulfurovaceae bacterium]|nr:hypothetical protein [Sulfurovaceae bacterium]